MLWRDFSALLARGKDTQQPGVVAWLALLKERKLLSRSQIRFQIAAVRSGDRDFFIDDVFGDSISFNSSLLSALGEEWIARIQDAIELAEGLAGQVGLLAKNLALAAGDADGSGRCDDAKGQTYFALDIPFRKWLEAIDPERDENRKEEIYNQWWKQAQQIARSIGAHLVSQSGVKAYIGRIIKDRKTERRYTAPECYNWFFYNTSSPDLLRKKGGIK
jgi:CRISPR system Cascade subunit CasA